MEHSRTAALRIDSSLISNHHHLLLRNFSSTPTPTTSVLLQGREKKKVGFRDSFAIPLRLVKQPSGWGMVGEILAGDDYGGLSYRVMFDPQTSSTFLFERSMKNSKKNRGIITRKNHLYDSSLSVSAKEIGGSESWFQLFLQDGSQYQGAMIDDSMEFGKLIMNNVHFGTVTYMSDVAASIRSGNFDGIVGLGFEGFTQGEDATCILRRMMDPHSLVQVGVERRAFSIYISGTGKSGEFRFGGINTELVRLPIIHHDVDLRPRATRAADDDEEESNDTSKSDRGRAGGSVTTIDSGDEEASADNLSDEDRGVIINLLPPNDVPHEVPFDPLYDIESSDDEETRRGGGSRTSSDGGTNYYDTHQDEWSMTSEEEEDDSGKPRRRLSDVSDPRSPKMKKDTTMPPLHDWMWGFNGLVTIGDSVVTSSTKEKKVDMAFSTLVPYGLVVNTREDYLGSTFHDALGSTSSQLLSVGDGVGGAEILILCKHRASLPQLSFKFGNEGDEHDVFAKFDGTEYFPTVLTNDDIKKLRKANQGREETLIKVKMSKWWKRWHKKTLKGKDELEKAKKGGQWCSTRDFIQFRQTQDYEEEIWQLGLGFMKKYVVEYEFGGENESHRIGIALSKGAEIELPDKRLKKKSHRFNFRKKDVEYK